MGVARKRFLIGASVKKQKVEGEMKLFFIKQELFEKQPISIRLQLDTFQKNLQQYKIDINKNTQIILIIKKILEDPDMSEKEN